MFSNKMAPRVDLCFKGYRVNLFTRNNATIKLNRKNIQPHRHLRTTCNLNNTSNQDDSKTPFDLPPYVHPTHSYAYGLSTKPFIIETIPQLLEKQAAQNGDKIIFTSHHEKKKVSYKTLKDEASRLASILYHKFGLRQGDMIGIWSLNIASWVTVKFASDYLGTILCTVNPYYKVDELAYLVNKSKCKILFMPGDGSSQLDHNNFTTIIRDDNFLNQIAQSQLKNIFILDGNKTCDKIGNYPVFSFDDFSSSESNEPFEINYDTDNPSCLMFTSGTTGKPKGALLSQFSMVNDCDFSSDRLGIFDGDDKICCPLPFFHSFAFTHTLICSAVRQKPFVITGYRFDVRAVTESILENECSILLCTPTMAIDLMTYMDKTNTKLDSLRSVCLGGALSDPDIIKRLKNKIPSLKSVLNGFGSTELSPAATLANWSDPEELVASTVGRPLPYVELKIVNPKDFTLVKTGEQGEIWVRGFNVMLEYFEDKEKTSEAIVNGGWYRTGDLGRMNDKGFFKIVGRIKEMIIRGGENVYPQEVENVLMSHPSINEAHVFGIPDERVGEEICTWIKLNHGAKELSKNEVRDFLKGKLTYFKIPRHVFFVDSFPMTVTFKVSKLLMRQTTVEMLQKSAK